MRLTLPFEAPWLIKVPSTGSLSPMIIRNTPLMIRPLTTTTMANIHPSPRISESKLPSTVTVSIAVALTESLVSLNFLTVSSIFSDVSLSFSPVIFAYIALYLPSAPSCSFKYVYEMTM